MKKIMDKAFICTMLEVPEIPYHGPVKQENFFEGAVGFLLLGYALMSFFFIQQTSGKDTKKKSSIVVELGIAVLSSGLLGCGFLLLALWAGLYV